MPSCIVNLEIVAYVMTKQYIIVKLFVGFSIKKKTIGCDIRSEAQEDCWLLISVNVISVKSFHL